MKKRFCRNYCPALVFAGLVSTSVLAASADGTGYQFKSGTNVDFTEQGVIVGFSLVGVDPAKFFKKVVMAVATSTTSFKDRTVKLQAYHNIFVKIKGRFSFTHTHNRFGDGDSQSNVYNEQMVRRWPIGKKGRLTLNSGISFVQAHLNTTTQTTSYDMPVRDIKLTFDRISKLGVSTLSGGYQRGGDFWPFKARSETTLGPANAVSVDYTKYTYMFMQKFKVKKPWSAMLSVSGQADNGSLGIFAKMATNSIDATMFFDYGTTYTANIGYVLKQPLFRMRSASLTYSLTKGFNKNNTLGYKDQTVTDIYLTTNFNPVNIFIKTFRPYIKGGIQIGNPTTPNSTSPNNDDWEFAIGITG